MRELQRHHADLGDVRLHYVTAGQRPAVVLLHGWPQTWYMWRDVIPGLAPRYRVIAPDLRGLGDSSQPLGDYDKKTLAHDIWRLTHDIVGEHRLFVVGHDWGGPVAYALAAQHRDAVRRMAIFDVPVPGDGTPVTFSNRWHHGLHWEPDFPEALTAGREEKICIWGSSTTIGVRGPMRSQRRRSTNTCAPIVNPARCARASISIAPRLRT